MESTGTEYLELIAKHLKGETSKSEEILLLEWKNKSVENKVTFDQFVKVWDISKNRVNEFKPDTEAAWQKVKSRLNESTNDYKVKPLYDVWYFAKIAAAVLLFLGLGYLGRGFYKNESVMIELATGDQRKEYYLPDSSKIWLNKNSKISYAQNFIGDKREVYLEGEAFFDVRKMNGKPFIIYGQFSKTEVVGTSFNIRAYKGAGREEIEVVTGKVAFSELKKEKQTKIFITPGYKAKLNMNSKLVKEKIEDPNFIAWKNDKLLFENTSLSEVVTDIENYFDIPVVVSNPELLKCRFTGSFEKPTIDEVLEVLAISINLSYDQKGTKFILSGKGCN